MEGPRLLQQSRARARKLNNFLYTKKIIARFFAHSQMFWAMETKTARIHVNLARTILQLKNGPLARAFALWSIIRASGKTHFDKDELIRFICEQTKRQPQTARKWINAGISAGLFITGNKNRLSLIGKHRVFDALLPQDKTPGFVVLVDIDKLLTAKLSDLRAALFATQFCRNKQHWIGRDRLAELTGTGRRTQIRYDYQNHQPKRPVYCLDKTTGEVKQLPNLYTAADGFKRPAINQSKRLNANGQKTCDDSSESLSYGRSFDRLRVNGSNLAEQKLLYDSPEAAQKAATRRAKKGLWPVTFSLVKPARLTQNAKRGGYQFVEMFAAT